MGGNLPVKTDTCSTLVSLNIFAGTEHDSANYSKVQESFRKHTAESANKGRAPPRSGVRFSKETVIDLSDDSELAKLIANSDTSKYNTIRTYVFKLLGGRNLTLSDGRTVIVDKTDAKEIAHKSNERKTAEIASIERIIQEAKYFADDSAVTHNKFDYFAYYFTPVRYKGKTYNVIINVGRAKNDGVFHLYDLTNDIKNKRIAGRLRGLSGPVGNRITNDSHKSTIRNSGENVKKYSLEPVEAVQPTSGEWERGSTTEEVREVHPQLWAVDAESSETRNPTQISGTVKSYRKIYDALDAEGFNGTILDASSGLGYGTRAGREEYGFNVDDIEPFPDRSYKPKYTDYSKLNKKYDVIISNAVLNVLPQDQRDALVVKMGKMLNVGGKMFINVRGTDVKNASSKVAIDEANMEYYISNTGSYQKGFTKRELIAYLSDALGSDYTITPSSKYGAVSAIVEKKGKSALDAKREAGQNQNRKYSREYSGKNVEWAVNNDIITENERAAFFHKVADVRKLGHKCRQTASGDYILEIGNKLLFTDADWKSPSLHMVVSFSDNSENSMLYAKEIIFNEAKSEADYNRARQIIEDTYWPGYVEFDYSRDHKADVGQTAGRKGSNSKANNEEPISYSREPESITELRRQNERLLTDTINEYNSGKNSLFYIDTAKAATLYGNARVTMPKIPRSRNGFVASIRDKSSPVKPKFENITETQQFKRWFGESKVVNADGSPKVVYHQTENDFTVFDTHRKGAGTRDNGTPFGIFLKSSGRDIGLKGKKQMALYARIINPLRARNRSEFRGMVDTENKTVMVRSDHPDISAEQIMRHEMGHAAIAQGDISLDELRGKMLSDLTEKELDSAVEVYRHAYGGTISEAETFEEMCCDALGKINIFAGTEHDSANYAKVQESFRKHTAETANKGRAPPKGGTKFSRAQRGRSVEIETMENNRFERLRAMHGHLPKEWFAFTSDKFYIYSNQSFSDYTILATANITKQNKAYIENFIEEVSNGTFPSSETFNQWTSTFRRGKGRNSWYSNDAEYSRNARRNDGVDGAAHRGRNASKVENGRFSQKDSRDNKTAVKKKFSMEAPVEEKQTLIDANTGKYIARNINGEHFGLTDDPSKAITEKRDIERAWASTKFMQKKGITLETATVTREKQKRKPYHPPKVDPTQRAREKQQADDFEQSIKDSYFYSHSRKNLTPYYRVESDVIINRTAAIELFVRAAKKMGALERHHSSRNGSKYSSSVYLVLDGTELRISDHELPYNAIRDNTRTRWDGEVILDDYTLREMVKLKSEKEYTEWVKECFESPERSDRTADYMPSFSREPESITELRRQNERLLAQATNEDAANENERGLIKDYKRQYDKVSGIAEKLNAARQELTAAESTGDRNAAVKKKIKKHRTHCPVFGRGRRLRTLGLRFWRPPLYQLSYSPIKLVGLQGLEPQTDRL